MQKLKVATLSARERVKVLKFLEPNSEAKVGFRNSADHFSLASSTGSKAMGYLQDPEHLYPAREFCTQRPRLYSFSPSCADPHFAVAAIKLGKQKELYLGNLDAKRDCGYALEFVEGMWRMLQQPQGDDYVLATNETHTVREFCEQALAHVGLNWRDHVKYNSRYERRRRWSCSLAIRSKRSRCSGGRRRPNFPNW